MTVNPGALELLLHRRSYSHLCEPAPDADALEQMLQAALQVPDHHYLRPYRFLLAVDMGRERLGEILSQAAQEEGQSEAAIAKAATMPLRAPLVITVVFSPDTASPIPLLDQQLCAASTVHTLQLAATALGFGAIWRSGWPMYSQLVAQKLGLAAHESIVGFLYVGTIAREQGCGRPDARVAEFISNL